MSVMPKPIKIQVQDMDKVKTLMDLLDKYREELPLELASSLDDLADCKSCEYDVDNIYELGFKAPDIKCFAEGKEIKRVKSINMILKKVECYNDDHSISKINPKSFSINNSEGKEKVLW